MTDLDKLEKLISDAEIARVHGHANFGDMSPREVVNDGVRKYAVGYSGGHTQLMILLEHGLITTPRPGRYDASLTKKGKAYARALFNLDMMRPASLLSDLAAKDAEIERLREALLGIALSDRYRRYPKQHEDGGLRGQSGLRAVRALTGQHGSYLSDDDVVRLDKEARALTQGEATHD